MRETTPWPVGGGGSESPDGAPWHRQTHPHMHEERVAADRNALTTPTAGVIALAAKARCNGAPLSETKVKAALAARFSVHSARNFIPEQLEVYTVSRSAANKDIPIKQISPNTVGQIDGRKPARSAGDFLTPTEGVIALAAKARCNGAPLSETKVKAALAARFSVHSARNFIPEQLEVYTVSPSAPNSDIPIKQLSPEHVGTDRTAEKPVFMRESEKIERF